ncbi:hypothetical protein ISS05_05130 [Candidatus Woesearchaeota archaeon]|nr:hypothetical protein [Candidatus Woesearchaeota archaeon]
MSQIEQDFRQFLSKKPEIEKSYQEGLINRRSLARYLIKNNIAKSNQIEAVIAMIRRFEFKKKEKEDRDLFRKTRINIKDKILILDLEKEKNLLKKLRDIIANTDYDKGDTLKIVVGSSSIKLFIDESNIKKLKSIIENSKIKHKFSNMSEISIMFSEEAIKEKGILSTITNELTLNNIVITELLTTTPELIIYLKEGYVLKAYEVIKRLQE